MPSYPVRLYLTAIAALMQSAQFGGQLALLNTSLKSVADSLHFDYHTHNAWVTSILLVGAFVGASVAGTLCDRRGPRQTLLDNCWIFTLGALISGTSTRESWFIFGRFISGLGVGAASLIVPRFLVEASPTMVRGALTTLHQIVISGGIMCGFALGWPYEGNRDFSVQMFGKKVPWWRCMVLATALIPLLQACLVACVCPESPVWLLWIGETQKAEESRQMLHGDIEETQETEEGEEEGQLLRPGAGSSILSEAESSQSPKNRSVRFNLESHDEDSRSEGYQALRDPKYRRILLLAIVIPFLQQMSGINSLILYGSEMFQQAGLKSAITSNLITGCVNLIATIGAAALMDVWGRKKLLVTSFFGMAVCLGGMAALLLLLSHAGSHGLRNFVVVAGILLYTVAFAIGCGPVPWVYLPEILPNSIKGPAQGVATSINWIGNLLVSVSFPYSLEYLGVAGSYATYAAICLFSALFCQREMVETKRRPLHVVHAELMAH